MPYDGLQHFSGKAPFIMAFSANLTIRNALGSFRFDYYL
jgi:hypothetical protein